MFGNLFIFYFIFNHETQSNLVIFGHFWLFLDFFSRFSSFSVLVIIGSFGLTFSFLVEFGGFRTDRFAFSQFSS